MRSLEQVHDFKPCTDNLFYQLDLTTPGISPLRASERKQRRHTPNLRRNARGRPQSWQRLCWRDLNFGFLASLTRFAVVAMFFYSLSCYELQKDLVVFFMLQRGRAFQNPSAERGHRCRPSPS